MQLQIKPDHKNSFPLKGILIKHPSVSFWIKEMQALELSLHDTEVYPIPGAIANSIWGCLIITYNKLDPHKTGKNELCQEVTANFFISEKTSLHPILAPADIKRLFSPAIHIFHPEFGLVELTEQLDPGLLINKPIEKSYYITKPNTQAFIPWQIKSLQVQPVTPEEVLKNLEQNIFPKSEKIKDKPLNIFEKVKLAFYQLLFTKTKNDNGGTPGGTPTTTGKTGLMNRIISLINSITKKENGWFSKMEQDFEDLEQRNQKEVDKLMELFRTNPEEALKYAIPLDYGGAGRGGSAPFKLTKRFLNFSLFGNSMSSATGSSNLGDHFYELQKQYNATAQNLIKQKEYTKAAFVYMKLLKNYTLAAQTLEAGAYYSEAATIYLKHAGNKIKAAECYEKGNMTMDAIGIHKDLNNNEKVGDLYLTIHKRKEADTYFTKVVDEYKSTNQYVKASLVFKNKLNDESGGQSLLMEGWRSNKDGFNCLNNYFANISDVKQLKKEINLVYLSDVSEQNRETFLKVLSYEYNRKNELSDLIKEMAYEVIAVQIPTNPSIVTELKSFNIKDKELVKDTIKFKLNKKN